MKTLLTFPEAKIVYEYNELSETAKRNAFDYFYEKYFDINDIEDCVNYCFIFGMLNSELKFQYDLSGSQGSGCNVYGYLDFKDAFAAISGTPENEENDIISKCADALDYFGISGTDLQYNYHYTYFLQNPDEIYNCIISQIMYSSDEEIENYESDIKNASHIISDFLKKICTDVYEYAKKESSEKGESFKFFCGWNVFDVNGNAIAKHDNVFDHEEKETGKVDMSLKEEYGETVINADFTVAVKPECVEYAKELIEELKTVLSEISY